MVQIMWPLVVRHKVLKLRKAGLTQAEIRRAIPGLPKGTVSGWVKAIRLTDRQKENILKRMSSASERGREKAGFTLQNKRFIRESEARRNAEHWYERYSKDPFFYFGVALYWAEGSKTSGMFQFMNSDPRLIKIMLRWLSEIEEVPVNLIKIRLYIHGIYNHENVENYWKNTLSLPEESFCRSVLKSTPHNLKKNPEYKGCVRIQVCRVELVRKMFRYWELMTNQYVMSEK